MMVPNSTQNSNFGVTCLRPCKQNFLISRCKLAYNFWNWRYRIVLNEYNIMVPNLNRNYSWSGGACCQLPYQPFLISWLGWRKEFRIDGTKWHEMSPTLWYQIWPKTPTRRPTLLLRFWSPELENCLPILILGLRLTPVLWTFELRMEGRKKRDRNSDIVSTSQICLFSAGLEFVKCFAVHN